MISVIVMTVIIFFFFVSFYYMPICSHVFVMKYEHMNIIFIFSFANFVVSLLLVSSLCLNGVLMRFIDIFFLFFFVYQGLLARLQPESSLASLRDALNMRTNGLKAYGNALINNEVSLGSGDVSPTLSLIIHIYLCIFIFNLVVCV